MGEWDNLRGRNVKVYLRYPIIKRNGELIDIIEGLCIVDGKKEIRIYDSKAHELIVVQKDNVVLMVTDLTVEDVESLHLESDLWK